MFASGFPLEADDAPVAELDALAWRLLRHPLPRWCSSSRVCPTRPRPRDATAPISTCPHVELVVAERDRVVPDRVHLGGHRMDRTALGHRIDARVVEPERGALDRVAGVEEQGVVAASIRADLVHHGRHTRVPVHRVAVDVGGAHDRDGHRLVVLSGDRCTGPAGRSQGARCGHPDQDIASADAGSHERRAAQYVRLGFTPWCATGSRSIGEL
jgi:hypothetical protein